MDNVYGSLKLDYLAHPEEGGVSYRDAQEFVFDHMTEKVSFVRPKEGGIVAKAERMWMSNGKLGND